MKKEELESRIEADKRDGNTCLALGAGVGALGMASAVLAGAVCPLCYFIAPGLMGVGAYKRWKASSLRNAQGENQEEKRE